MRCKNKIYLMFNPIKNRNCKKNLLKYDNNYDTRTYIKKKEKEIDAHR